MEQPAKRPDRRIARTRHLLQQAFLEVAHEKSFASITVQDIADRANVNRGTFYAHFEDKYALFDTIIREDFRQLLDRNLPPKTAWDRDTLHTLVVTVLDYFKGLERQCRPPDVVAPLIERATLDELADAIGAWLRRTQAPSARTPVPLETVARLMSWSIFGAAAQWSQESGAQTSAQLANEIVQVIMGGVEQLIAPRPPQPA
jgi:AcrR family transcriptional regulator